jgi:hypothetical protein
VLQPEEDALQQDVHREVVVGDGGGLDRAERATEAGVVEEHVEATEAVGRLGHHGGDVLLLGDIGPQERGGRAEVGRQCLTLGLIEIGDQHLGALVDEATNGAGADAARASRDRGDLAREPVHVLPPGVECRPSSARGQILQQFRRRLRVGAPPRTRCCHIAAGAGVMSTAGRDPATSTRRT